MDFNLDNLINFNELVGIDRLNELTKLRESYANCIKRIDVLLAKRSSLSRLQNYLERSLVTDIDFLYRIL